MKHHSLFDAKTGLFIGRVFATDLADEVERAAALARNTPAGMAHIEGIHDHLSRKVDLATGEVVDHQPAQPSDDHEWDSGSRRWQLNAAAAKRHADVQEARTQIAQLEASQPRALREFALGYDGAAARLKAIDEEIISLRAKL